MSHRPVGDVRVLSPIWSFCPCRSAPNYAETSGRYCHACNRSILHTASPRSLVPATPRRIIARRAYSQTLVAVKTVTILMGSRVRGTVPHLIFPAKRCRSVTAESRWWWGETADASTDRSHDEKARNRVCGCPTKKGKNPIPDTAVEITGPKLRITLANCHYERRIVRHPVLSPPATPRRPWQPRPRRSTAPGGGPLRPPPAPHWPSRRSPLPTPTSRRRWPPSPKATVSR